MASLGKLQGTQSRWRCGRVMEQAAREAGCVLHADCKATPGFLALIWLLRPGCGVKITLLPSRGICADNIVV